MRRVSIEDIARQAEVSHSTVSLLRRANKRISLAVRTRILQIATELGYTPNAIAQSLQQRQTNTLGLSRHRRGRYPFWGEVVKGVESVSMHNQKALFSSASQYDPSRQLAVIEVFHQRRVDGIIVGDSQLGDAQITRLARIKVPTVSPQ
jgi:LacI family transcriptional regulator/LacI family repressor for deo operon, udp, cdd, tsx, nupC, and nupG